MDRKRSDRAGRYSVLLVLLMTLYAVSGIAEDDNHDEHAKHVEEEHDEHEGEVRLIFTPAERAKAGIDVGPVSDRFHRRFRCRDVERHRPGQLYQ